MKSLINLHQLITLEYVHLTLIANYTTNQHNTLQIYITQVSNNLHAAQPLASKDFFISERGSTSLNKDIIACHLSNSKQVKNM